MATQTYGLMQTLIATPLPTDDMRSKQKIELKNRLNELDDSRKEEAVLRLILEYFHSENPESDFKSILEELPYRGKYENENPKFYLEKLPVPLKWLLWRFTEI